MPKREGPCEVKRTQERPCTAPLQRNAEGTSRVPICAVQVQGWVLAHARASHGLAGSCFWSLSAGTFPDYDGYKVHLQPAAMAPTRPPQQTSRRDNMERERRAMAKTSALKASVPAVPLGRNAPAPHAIGDAVSSPSSRIGSTEQADSGGPAGPSTAAEQEFAEPSKHLGLQQQRVSNATQEACEAACGMFESSAQQSSEEAWRQDEATASLIAQHARAMRALNGLDVGRQRAARLCDYVYSSVVKCWVKSLM